MTNERKFKTVAAVVTALFFVALLGIGYMTQLKSGLESSLDQEKLKSENLLSEKLKLDKEIITLNRNIDDLTGKNRNLDVYLSDLKNKLAEKEEAIGKLSKERGSIDRLRKEIKSVQSFNQELQAKITELTGENSSLAAQLDKARSTINDLNLQNEKLESRITSMESSRAYNYLVEVLKKNQSKMTVRAKRTHTVLVSFDMPKVDKPRNFRFDLQSPSGKDLKGDLKVQVNPSEAALTASLEKVPATGILEKVTLRFEPEERLDPGTYSLFIYDGHQFIGNLHFKLSK